MPCFKPLTAWRSSEVTSNGKNRIVFKKSANHSLVELKLPCGQCIGCRLQRSLVWATRCIHEAQLHDQNCFITLTYSDQHLPHNGSLIKSDFQKFMKRLRKSLPGKKIKYYMCGEYGEQLSRPHYHVCLFGHNFADREPFSSNGDGIITYTSATLEKLWKLGYSNIGELNFKTAAYTARYITKKITGEKAYEHYMRSDPTTGEIFHLEPEYNCMSLKPGIGAEWFKKYKSDVYPSDYLVHNNKKMNVPRFYDKLLEKENPHELEIYKRKRKERARRHSEEQTEQRLATREKIQHLKHKRLKRSLENDT